MGVRPEQMAQLVPQPPPGGQTQRPVWGVMAQLILVIAIIIAAFCGGIAWLFHEPRI